MNELILCRSWTVQGALWCAGWRKLHCRGANERCTIWAPLLSPDQCRYTPVIGEIASYNLARKTCINFLLPESQNVHTNLLWATLYITDRSAQYPWSFIRIDTVSGVIYITAHLPVMGGWWFTGLLFRKQFVVRFSASFSCVPTNLHYSTIKALNQATFLLYHLIFGIEPNHNLRYTLQHAPHRPFNCISHIFVVTFGRLSYSEPPNWIEASKRQELESLAGTFLSAVDVVMYSSLKPSQKLRGKYWSLWLMAQRVIASGRHSRANPMRTKSTKKIWKPSWWEMS